MTAAAIVWALINSVWQSAAILGALALLSRTVKLSAAQLHALWFSALLAAAALPIADLAVPARSIPVPIPAYESVPSNAASRLPLRAVRPVAAPAHVESRTVSVHTQSSAPSRPIDPAGIMLLFWALGALGLLLRLTFGYVRLRAAKTAVTPDDALTERAAELGIACRRTMSVGTSRTLTEPCVIGFYRPVVAVPAPLATALTQADLDRILRHESAHIARYDDYTNLLCQIVRAALFFNPFVHAIARSMALEAESACDDVAAHAERERVAFAKCLYELARMSRRRYSPAAGFFGSRRQIGLRVARLLERNRASSSRMTLTLKAAAALVVLSGIALGSLRVTALAAAVREPVTAKITQPAGSGSRDVSIAPAPALAAASNSALAAQPIVAAIPSNLTAPSILRMDAHIRIHVHAHEAEERRRFDMAEAKPKPMLVAQAGSGDLIDALDAAGYRGLSPDDLIQLSGHGVTAELVNDLHARGVGPLPVHTLVALVDHGVTAGFISAIRSAGYGMPDPEVLVRLADHGVTADYVRTVDAAARTRISLDDFARMVDAGVSTDLIRQLSAEGYRGITGDQYIRMANAGITARFVKRIVDSRLTSGRLPTVDQLIELANAGV
ncbi:MAG TPA: M56 family metallopeptidase [Candidatus Baltobacteraceae bacterium]|nr:M56 family metallopeptidase [Candidatus Baltobacteraceae bacterium]